MRRGEGVARGRARAGQGRSRKVEGRAVIIEALVHVGAVLQMLLEQVDLAVARRRVKGHGEPRHLPSPRRGPVWASATEPWRLIRSSCNLVDSRERQTVAAEILISGFSGD